MIRQVAKFLGVNINLILRCEEWFTVLFVIAKGFRPRFVSKKILKQKPEFFPGDLVFSDAGCCYEVIASKDHRVYCYPIDLTIYNLIRSNEQFVFAPEQLRAIVSSYPATREIRQPELLAAPTKSIADAPSSRVKAAQSINN